jgi:aryl-alcohol dehydrogenase-like predicted oxidoreductase
MSLRFSHPPDTIRLGELEVRRLGFGAMRLPGPGVWGEPSDPSAARAVLRRAVELGVNLIDTAWFYGPHVANRLIAEALHPYPSDLVIATKLGAKRPPDKSWVPAIAPAELRRGVEDDLRVLKLQRLDVVHLRWTDPAASVSPSAFAEALDALIAMQREGLIRHLALSNVTVAQIDQAEQRTPIVAVQNLFHLDHPTATNVGRHVSDPPEQVLAACEQRGIAFLPFFPLAMGALATAGGGIEIAARKHGCTAAQLAIAWLLARSPVMLPIPGTCSIAHVEENCGATRIVLDPAEIAELAAAPTGN